VFEYQTERNWFRISTLILLICEWKEHRILKLIFIMKIRFLLIVGELDSRRRKGNVDLIHVRKRKCVLLCSYQVPFLVPELIVESSFRWLEDGHPMGNTSLLELVEDGLPA